MAKKYKDYDKLIAEIRKLRSESCISESDDYYEYAKSEIIDIIASLQQEQPDKYETALEKAREWMPNVNQGGHAILIDIFPELGEGLDPRYGDRKQEQPDVDLEKEIEIYWGRVKWGSMDMTAMRHLHFEKCARHFYELGCRHVAVLYDDIEYERQRREAEEKEIDLESLARKKANETYPPMYECPDDNYKQRSGFCRGFKIGYNLGLNNKK